MVEYTSPGSEVRGAYGSLGYEDIIAGVEGSIEYKRMKCGPQPPWLFCQLFPTNIT